MILASAANFAVGVLVFTVVVFLGIWRLERSYQRMLQALFERASKSRRWLGD